jgi:nucleoside-diphosphate kinase
MDQKDLEQTLVLIKPDALKNSLTGYVLSQLSEFHTGLRFAAAKIVRVSRMLAEEHYAEHFGKPFYEPLLDYIRGYAHYPDSQIKRRVIAFIYQGANAVLKIRDISGPTNPHDAREKRPGSIRALGTIVPVKNPAGTATIDRIDNLIHASANLSDAEREIKLWFKPNDIPPSMRIYATEESDAHYYFKNKQLLTAHEPGSTCLLAPGDTAWQSDLAALRLISRGQPAPITATAIAAKYLINEDREDR